MKAKELREMSDENIDLTFKDTVEHLFRLRIRAQTEKKSAAAERRKSLRLIARIHTVKREREINKALAVIAAK